tara:strand:+ start:611 stop:811 length:201 start_codon:yes stop_codon:yes gene_type:complete
MNKVNLIKNEEYYIPHLKGKANFKKVYKNFFKTYYKTEDYFGFTMTSGKYKGTEIKLSKDLIKERA